MSEESVKVASLVEKLAGWVEAQPEYPYLFLADRARRKRAARIVAERLLLIPTVRPDPDGVDRASRRAQQRVVSGIVGDYRGKLSKKQQRMLAEGEKQRRRYHRLSMQRTHELALLLNAEFDRRAELVAAMEAEVAAAEAYEGEQFEYAPEEGENSAESQTEVE